MGAKKILSYGRRALVIFLVLYLIVVWMYFEDNARQLTSSGLILWFVAIPLLFIGTIVALLWWQKKLDKRASDKAESLGETSDKKENVKLPDIHQLFIFSRVCLPEGNSWSDVIDNDQDLTVLSEDLTNFDGMPMLVKPIKELTDAASLPYSYRSNDHVEDTDFDNSLDNNRLDNHVNQERFEESDARTERIATLDDTTLRLCSLIHEQIALSDELLSVLAEHFYQHHQQDNAQSNSAINIHPEWQQHYLVSAEQESDDDSMSTASNSYLSKLPIYLCLPASADSAPLITAIKEQLATYGISDILLSFTVIVADDNESADSVTSEHIDDIATHDPAGFINKHLVSLSQSAIPDLCLLLIVDSQMSDDWLDTHLHSQQTSNIVPTEAGALLVFFNKAAQDLLNIETSTSVLLTEVHTPDAKHHDSHTTERMNNRRGYLNHLTTIKNLLIDNELSLVPTNTASPKTLNKPTTKPDDTETKTNVAPLDTSITAISDINPSTQPYDMSVYMSFVEAFITKGALVNEYHLGHYMPFNNWLKSFISLSLFVDLAEKDQQESDSLFLITQHKHCSILWLADDSQKSEP
ncbi:MAG: hypothetical protein ACTH7W_08095 [Psychrobacter sp.]|uniref:hypothetical protein n=3 Tax=Psychrobacter TaxID=497 RepID=UPI0017882E5F|nr:hypothetical protein [Psychrobacter sp. FME13]MBE0442514.1 hypothetical protein [Psychrobacter sp. FME13]